MTASDQAPVPVRADPAVVDAVIARTIAITLIPAPPLDEGDRARQLVAWFTESGCSDVHLDPAGNVWGKVQDGQGPALVVCAHMDTVFDRSVAHRSVRNGDRLVGPGVGDDNVALAAISVLPRLLSTGSVVAEPAAGAPIWVLATVGEEGLGDLAGAKAAVADAPEPMGAMLAVEGNYLGRLGTRAVGSLRYRVALHGPGGHAWERSEASNAVHVAAALITDLGAAPRPTPGRTAINVGRMGGGEAINARARVCWYEVDLRADRSAALLALDGIHTDLIARTRLCWPDVKIEVQPLGSRPAGAIDEEHPLVMAARSGYAAAGVNCRLIASSTDANAAHAAGIPALALGVTIGEQEHTESEWIDLSTLPAGLAGLTETVRNYRTGGEGR